MDNDECRNLISGLPCMLELSESIKQVVIGTLMDLAAHETMSEGDSLFTEGAQAAGEGYVLLSGNVSVEKSYSSTSTCAAPELLGEIGQFNPESNRTATVTASEELEVLRFDWNELYAVLQKKLDDEEQEHFRRALLDQAWEHLLR